MHAATPQVRFPDRRWSSDPDRVPIGPTADDPRRDQWPQQQREAALGASSHAFRCASASVSMSRSHCQPPPFPRCGATGGGSVWQHRPPRSRACSLGLGVKLFGDAIFRPCRSRSCTVAFWRKGDSVGVSVVTPKITAPAGVVGRRWLPPVRESRLSATARENDGVLDQMCRCRDGLPRFVHNGDERRTHQARRAACERGPSRPRPPTRAGRGARQELRLKAARRNERNKRP
jgi:hypothetical protein